jgi:hypothetical protein
MPYLAVCADYDRVDLLHAFSGTSTSFSWLVLRSVLPVRRARVIPVAFATLSSNRKLTPILSHFGEVNISRA